MVKAEYSLSNAALVTGGLGFLTTGEQIVSDVGGIGIEKVRFINRYSYIVLPVGAKIYIAGDRFFVSPEVGVAYNLNAKRKVTEFLDSGGRKDYSQDIQVFPGKLNQFTFPAILSLGTEIPVGQIQIILALTGYYSMNQVVSNIPRSNHYFGGGLLVGCLF